jgi:hypothetical protein
MTNILCLVGKHNWSRQNNPEVSGADGVYCVCIRCGKEKKEYGGRSQGPGGIVLGGG